MSSIFASGSITDGSVLFLDVTPDCKQSVHTPGSVLAKRSSMQTILPLTARQIQEKIASAAVSVSDKMTSLLIEACPVPPSPLQ